MSEQEENELLCEKLLGWKRAKHKGTFGQAMWYDDPYGSDGAQWSTCSTPSFRGWADCGLLLDALAKRGVSINIHFMDLEFTGSSWDVEILQAKARGITATSKANACAAIRSAALAYVRSQKC